MGDVCGKGAEAAAVTAMVRYTIRAAVMRNRSPAGILRWLNAAMLRQRAGRFVTLAIARLELEPDGTVIVTVSSGGHPLPRILRSTGLVEEIGTTGTLLGVLEDVDLEDRSTQLAPGDALVLYTDGLTEVTAPRVWSRAHLDRAVAGARRLRRAGDRRPPRRAGRGGGRRASARRPRAARAAGSALAVGIDVDVVDLPLAAAGGA